MGALFSKSASSTAVQAAKRQYPTRVPPTTSPASRAPRPAPSAASPSPSDIVTGPNQVPRNPDWPPVDSGPPGSETTPEGFDPRLGAALREIGPVRPAPTLSHSSTFAADPTAPLASRSAARDAPTGSPALRVLAARRELARRADAENAAVVQAGALEARRRWRQERGQEEVEEEDEGATFEGREFLDVGLLRRIVELRAKGTAESEIEDGLGLKKGVAGRMGPIGVVGIVDYT